MRGARWGRSTSTGRVWVRMSARSSARRRSAPMVRHRSGTIRTTGAAIRSASRTNPARAWRGIGTARSATSSRATAVSRTTFCFRASDTIARAGCITSARDTTMPRPGGSSRAIRWVTSTAPTSMSSR